MTDDEKRKEHREVDRENFKRQGETATNNANFLDHWILTASLGAFGLSFAFIRNMTGYIHYKSFLYASWVLFFLSAFSVGSGNVIVISIAKFTQRKINEHRENKGQVDYTEIKNSYEYKIMKGLVSATQIVGLSSFAIALICALVFAISNVNYQINEQNGIEIERQSMQAVSPQPSVVNNYYYAPQAK